MAIIVLTQKLGLAVCCTEQGTASQSITAETEYMAFVPATDKNKVGR